MVYVELIQSQNILFYFTSKDISTVIDDVSYRQSEEYYIMREK